MDLTKTVITKSFIEIMNRLYGDVSFELTPSIIGGLIVGACTMIGGLMGGRFGLLIGGSVGSSVNSYFGPRIITLQQMLQRLNMNQLKNLYILLSEEIKNIVVNVLGCVFKGKIQLVNLLEMFGGNSTVRSNVIKILTNFFKDIYSKRLHLIAT